MPDIEALKSRVTAEIEAQRDDLIRIADTIHAHPEVAFEEFDQTYRKLKCIRTEPQASV